MVTHLACASSDDNVGVPIPYSHLVHGIFCPQLWSVVLKRHMLYLQVECSVLPELGAKKKSTPVRGASGPISIQVPLLITAQDSASPPGTSASALGDWQAVPGPGVLAPSHGVAVSTAEPASSSQSVMTTGTGLPSGAYPGEASPEGVQQNQMSARSTRAGKNKRKVRSAEETHAAAVADVAEPAGLGNGSKHHKPDLQPLQDAILRLVLRQRSLS